MSGRNAEFAAAGRPAPVAIADRRVAAAVPVAGRNDDSDGLHYARLDTDGMDEDAARRAYLASTGDLLHTEFLAPFAGRIESYRIGTLGVQRVTATPRRSSRRTAAIRHDRNDAVAVYYVVDGHATGDAAGRSFASDPGTILILDLAQPFTIADLGPRRLLTVAVPRSDFPDRRDDPAAWHGAVLTGETAGPLAAFLAQLAHGIDALPDAAGDALAAAFGQLLIVALGDHAPASAANTRDARLIRRAEKLVNDRIGSPDLHPSWLAAELGLSRSKIYTLMEPYGGVARFIMQRRLTRARQAIEDPSDGRRISAIAYAFGFASEAYFSRLFRATFGAPPSGIRRDTRRA